MKKNELEELVERLTVEYEDYHSIKKFSVQGSEEDGYYVSVGLVKVSSNVATSAQYDYLTGLKNTDWKSNGTLRNASKAAISACIDMAKKHPDVEFYFYKW